VPTIKVLAQRSIILRRVILNLLVSWSRKSDEPIQVSSDCRSDRSIRVNADVYWVGVLFWVWVWNASFASSRREDFRVSCDAGMRLIMERIKLAKRCFASGRMRCIGWWC